VANNKQKHEAIMLASDFVGSMIGGLMATLFFWLVIYYGFGGSGVLCQ